MSKARYELKWFWQFFKIPDPDKIPSVIWVELYPHFLWPVSHVFLTASTYMTVVISIDR